MPTTSVERRHSTLAVAVFAVLGLLSPAVLLRARSGTQARSRTHLISDLVLYQKGTVAFQSRPVPSEALEALLKAVTPSHFLSRWKLIVVKERSNRLKVLEAMQSGFRRLGRDDLSRAMERWKGAPLLLVFCMPKTVQSFGGVPSDMVRPQAHVELGEGAQGLMLVARAYGVETHWIAGALLVGPKINDVLNVPEEYDIVSFAVAGYPEKEIEQKYPPVQEVCYGEAWGKTIK